LATYDLGFRIWGSKLKACPERFMVSELVVSKAEPAEPSEWVKR